MNPTLQGYTSAVLETIDSAKATTVAAELGAFEGLVASSPELLTMLGDTALSGTVRRAIVTDLLSAKVDAITTKLAGQAVMLAKAQEVLIALSWMATRVRHHAEGIDFTEVPLSALSARRRVAGYATCCFEDLSTSELETVEDELFKVARTVESTSAIRSVMVDRDVPALGRAMFLRGLLQGKVSVTTVRLAGYVAIGGRPRDVVGTLDHLVNQTAAARGWRVARVQSAAELSGTQQGEIEQSLTSIAGAPVDLQVTIDDSLLAGIIVEIGDLRLDDTVRGRLAVLREHVATSTKRFNNHLSNDSN